jgi:hypothetical protein
MTEFVSYASKSTALRGIARQHKDVDANLDVFVVQDGGKWGFWPDKVATHLQTLAAGEADELMREGEAEDALLNGPVENSVAQGVLERAAAKADFGNMTVPEYDAVPPGDIEKTMAKNSRRKSAEKGSVAMCWEFYSANTGLRRKDAIQAMVDKGVAFYTARTQYQLWFSEKKVTRLK